MDSGLEQDLEAFLPTWERMLAGIERLDRETGRPGPKMVKVPAPVEAVEVVISELQVRARQYSGTVPEYTLRVISRLRRGGGCSRFDSYEVKKEAHSIAVMVSNLEVADQGASCTGDVPTFITEIPLGTDFDPGQPYTVVVNGNVTNTFVARMPFIPGTPVGPKMVKKAAPIDRVELAVSESEPPEYSLRVVSRLPRGRACSELNGFDIVRRTDGRIEVTLTNLEVAVEDATCGTDRPTVVTVVPLGSDFAAGETYMIVVNEEPMEPFVAR